MTARPTVLFIGMLGAPGRYDPALFAGAEGGDDEVHWFRVMLRDLGLLDRIDFDGLYLSRGEALPDPGAHDAVIVGGSFHSVHDGLPWQRDLVAWLHALRETGTPLFGICGGHQMIGQMEGAAVDTVPSGPMAGTLEAPLTAEGLKHFLFDGLAGDSHYHFGNYERLSAAPESATVLAADSKMPAMALDHGGAWYSVQFHPEIRADVIGNSWSGENAHYRHNYRETPDAPKIFRNFLYGTGVLSP